MDSTNKRPELKIDPEFKALIRALSEDERKALEESIIKDGCRDAIVIWDNTIIDGHNRYEICKKLGRFFKETGLQFSSREEVIKWIIKNQLSRRNLTPDEISYYRGKLYNENKKEISNSEGKNQHSPAVNCQTVSQPPKNTAEQIAEKENVSPRTVVRDGQFAKSVDAIAKATNESPLVIANALPKSEVGAVAGLSPTEQQQRLKMPKRKKAKSRPKQKKAATGERTAKRSVALPISLWNLIDSVSIDSDKALTKIVNEWKSRQEKKEVAAAAPPVLEPVPPDGQQVF